LFDTVRSDLKLFFTAARIIERNLAYFITEDMVSIKNAKVSPPFIGARGSRAYPPRWQEIPVWARRICAQLAPHALSLVAAFGYPDHALAAPIAVDWIGYNIGDNQGEVSSRLLQDS